MKRTRFNDVVWNLNGIYADNTQPVGRSRYVSGSVATPSGFVHAFTLPKANNPDGDGPTTGFYFIHRGRVYQRRYNRIFTSRGLVRVAAKFAREVVTR